MKSRRYYIAYGSNLNVPQMKARCPGAVVLGTACLHGWELLFRGSGTGSYLTMEKSEGGCVPVVVWEITDADEKALDRYGGYPGFYYKKNIRVRYRGIVTGCKRTVNAFAYIMHEDRRIGVPSVSYMRTCLDGYGTFLFDRSILIKAYDKCRRMTLNEE